MAPKGLIIIPRARIPLYIQPSYSNLYRILHVSIVQNQHLISYVYTRLSFCVCVCVCRQSEIEELEKKLAELRGEEARLGAAIAEEEARIQAVHLELDSEDAGLHEERDGIARRELELLAQQVQCTCVKQ